MNFSGIGSLKWILLPYFLIICSNKHPKILTMLYNLQHKHDYKLVKDLSDRTWNVRKNWARDKIDRMLRKNFSPKSKADFIQLLNFSEYSLIRIHSYTVLVKNITLKCFYSVSTESLENTVAWFTKIFWHWTLYEQFLWLNAEL